MSSRSESNQLVEHFFRHEYGRLVSTLARNFGLGQLGLIEDAVQSALLQALGSWQQKGAPDDPAAWLYRVAKNRALDAMRRQGAQARVLQAQSTLEGADEPSQAASPSAFPQEIDDDLLRMLFVCADPEIPPDSRLVFALKTLCGFSTWEIALRLLTSEANVQKRLTRARERLATSDLALATQSFEVLAARRDAVHQMIYLLFNEGYSSAREDRPIRAELCDEALRLGYLLAEHPVAGSPEADALLALMYLHAARLDARLDGSGGLLLLEEQDRSLWDQDLIRAGLHYLSRSARGNVFSRYHAEAAVAAEHCLAKSYAETRWLEIVDAYSVLERLAPSPLHTLNRAIAVAEWQGAAAGLAILRPLKPPAWLAGYYIWDATLGELERRAGNLERAVEHLRRAQAAAPTQAERARIARRLALCER